MTLGSNGRQSRQASHESEKLYRLLAENSTDMISKHTSEGVYTYASPACRSLLGYEPEELVGHSAYEFFHPEDLERTRTTHSMMLQYPDVYTVSYRIQRKDGSYIWFETTSRRVWEPGTDEVPEIISVSRDITQRKRVEEELRESQEALRKSEEFHRLAVEAGRIGTWDLDLQTQECLISPKMAELMDFSPEQTTVPGLQWWESIVPEDRTLMTSALAASNENDAPFDLEFRIALKDGRERWLYSRGAVSRDASGKALRVHGASIDVTERKRTEEKLRESEERLRRAIEIETVGVIFFKTDGSITEANDAFLRMSGYNREDLVEGLVRWDEMTPPEWMPHSLKAIEEFKLTGRTIPYEKEYVRKDGSRWCALFAATRLDEEEGVEFIIDITERKRAEEALQEANERITNILESITDAFVAVDRQWRFTYLNERALTTLQRTREELLGKNMWEAFPEAVELPAYREYHRAMTSGTPVHFEEFNPWQGIWVEINAYPSEGGLAVYFRDITERKRAQEAFAELLRARTEFMTNVSHELRTPLTVIRGNAEVGLELGRECVHEEILEEIVRESGSMSRMVEDLLFLARSDSDSLPLDKQMVPVAWLLNKLARRAEALVSRRDTSLRTKLSGEGRLGCDAQSIEQAVLVLVDNAANYGTPGGSITLSSSTRQGELLIEVADRGPGIPPEELPQIFERFYRGESSSEERGSGLGLAIAKTIAEAHGGSVEAESRLGEGTRMFLRLPLANGA